MIITFFFQFHLLELDLITARPLESVKMNWFDPAPATTLKKFVNLTLNAHVLCDLFGLSNKMKVFESPC